MHHRYRFHFFVVRKYVVTFLVRIDLFAGPTVNEPYLASWTYMSTYLANGHIGVSVLDARVATRIVIWHTCIL